MSSDLCETLRDVSHILGYARVSTLQQDEALQLDALTAAGAARIYTDRVSTRAERRPELDRLLERADAGDTIVVWRLDRLARSLTELIALVDEFGRRQVHLRSLGEQIDTGTAGGRLLFHLMASIAEFERDLIRERTMAGLHAAQLAVAPAGAPRPLPRRSAHWRGSCTSRRSTRSRRSPAPSASADRRSTAR